MNEILEINEFYFDFINLALDFNKCLIVNNTINIFAEMYQIVQKSLATVIVHQCYDRF